MYTSIINVPRSSGAKGGGGWIRMRTRTEDATCSRNNNSSPSGSQPGWERGPAAGRELEKHSPKHNREPPDQISPPRQAFPRDPDPPCSCHFSCYRTSVKRQRRCPCAGRGWFTNISGEYNYTAPPAEQPYAAASGERRGGVVVVVVEEEGGWWTVKTAFRTLFFLPGTQDRVSIVVNKINLQLRRLSNMLRSGHAMYLTAPYRNTFRLWYEQTAHLPHSPRY